jgi:hypothetical protein
MEVKGIDPSATGKITGTPKKVRGLDTDKLEQVKEELGNLIAAFDGEEEAPSGAATPNSDISEVV